MTFFDNTEKELLKIEKQKRKLQKQLDLEKRKLQKDQVKSKLLNYDEELKKLVVDREALTEFNNLKKCKEVNYLKKRGWVRKLMQLVIPGNKYLVKMQLNNGEIVFFIIKTQHKYFVYQNGAYVIEMTSCRKDKGTGLRMLEYIQGCSLPIDLQLKASDIIREIDDGQHKDVEMSIDPAILKLFVEGTFVEKVMQGDALDKDLGLLRILMIITVVMELIILILVFKGAT